MSADKKLFTHAALGLMIGVSQQRISILCKKEFKPALVNGKIDYHHPAVQQFIDENKARKAAVDSPSPKKKIPPKKKRPKSRQFEDQTPTFESIEALTIREVVERHGTIAGFKLYVDSLRGMADWKNKELKYLQQRGKVIEIEPLASSLFSLVDLSWKRIVAEFPGAIAPQLKAIVLSSGDNSVIEMRSLMEKELSQILKGVKIKISRDIKESQKDEVVGSVEFASDSEF